VKTNNDDRTKHARDGIYRTSVRLRDGRRVRFELRLADGLLVVSVTDRMKGRTVEVLRQILPEEDR
jgi:hypothetical protein